MTVLTLSIKHEDVGLWFCFLISSFLHNPLSSRPDSNTIFPRGPFLTSPTRNSLAFSGLQRHLPSLWSLEMSAFGCLCLHPNGQPTHLGRTAGPPHSTTLVRRGCTKVFLRATHLALDVRGWEGTAHRFKWAACLGDRDHTKLKADSTNLGDHALHIYTAPGSKGSPHPHPPAEKFSSQNEAEGDGSLPSLPRGCSEQLGRCLDHLVCAQMEARRAFRHRSPSEWLRAKGKPIYFIKNHRVSYSQTLQLHSHLALGVKLSKTRIVPVLQSSTWNPSMLPRNLQDMAWHSSLHGIWPQASTAIFGCASLGPKQQTPSGFPVWSLSLLHVFLSQHFIQDRGFKKSSICSSDRFSSGLDCSCQLQNIISHCLPDILT